MSIFGYMYNSVVIVTKLMKYEIFSCQTPTVRLDRIFSTGSRNKERMKIYIKQIITYTDISKPYNQSQNCFVIAFNNLGI